MSTNLSHLNNPKSKPRRVTKFKLSFPTIPSLLKEPRKVDLYEKQGNHDVLVVTFTTTGQTWFDTVQTGVPVQFHWNQGSLERTWYGYVSSISKTVAPSQRERLMEVHCIGSSFPLKERATKTFTDVTVSEVAAIIAQENGLGFVGDKDSRKFPQLVIAGHSYWEWLQEQAKRIGFAMFVSENTLYFRNFDSIINQNVTSIPTLYSDNSSSTYRGQYLDRTLDEFEVMKSEYAENSDHLRTEKNLSGVNPLTGEMVSSVSSPGDSGDKLRSNVSDVLFSEYRTDQVVLSNKDAESASKGAASMARFNLPARVKCAGDPRFRPYYPVRVLGTGNLTDGYWVIKEAHHIFQKFGDYNVTMKIVTDGTGANNVTNFRGNENRDVSTVNIPERLAFPMHQLNKDIKLVTSAPGFLPGKQGFKRTPALWQTVTRKP
jgi:phage protein D